MQVITCEHCGTEWLGLVLPSGQVLDPVEESGGGRQHDCPHLRTDSARGLWQQMQGTWR